mmetsp:Transcript_14865/g.22869  ORF Transcript_14865/g.22869 Transcript_14865/m.22869 type:complete len:419 (+) Transcript_14865:179-1435(+)|eukprot:CAMPEP_0194224328 /NCGR_PEP_ID=MMETSP0156-20130528/37199_1 /TAXON_ID=33649 /ORGANISM="Thalassionema nitzschioides, Strain L26-B" /LENGTH=418 /DNA_ID=CAMNT_0038955839 /DNA_START=107 /DNA_END=1363 /DNA_ORIENTATION=+
MNTLLSESSSTWQKRIFLPYVTQQEGTDHSFAYEYDNVSQSPQYCDYAYDVCNNDDGVMMTALRWTRIFILKVGRMYYGAPLCLMLLPLMVGLAIGYGFGRIKQQRAESNNTNKERDYQKNSKIWSFFDAFDTIFNALSLFSRQYITLLLSSCTTGTQKQNNAALPSKEKEARMRHELLSNEQTIQKKKKTANTPQHIAVIMDGNRRYGRETYPENPLQGHVDGSQTLLKFAEWCLEESVEMLTVYAFSTENWNRPPKEVAALMTILQTYSDELRTEALKRRIRIQVHSTDQRRIPKHVQSGLDRMVRETAQFQDSPSLILNICLSYGSRDELVQACRRVAASTEITEESIQQALLIPHNPDIVIRTSGEVRLSNFLLWQTAYSEWFFLDKHWPALEKEDFLQVLNDYAHQRKRRFGT